MEENLFPQDDPIAYFKSTFQEDTENGFQSIFIGCPRQLKLTSTIIFSIFLGLYFIISTFIGNILLVPLSVDGASMYPTLNADYTTTGDKMAKDVVYIWKTHNVTHSDIIVFNANRYNGSPDSTTPTYYIKRVIAVSGDTIKFTLSDYNPSTGVLTYDVCLNGIVLDEDYISSKITYQSGATNPEIVTSQHEITIPTGFVFVMGDNRNNSKDSREMGLISTKDILGKMVLHIPYGKTVIFGIYTSLKNNYIF